MLEVPPDLHSDTFVSFVKEQLVLDKWILLCTKRDES